MFKGDPGIINHPLNIFEQTNKSSFLSSAVEDFAAMLAPVIPGQMSREIIKRKKNFHLQQIANLPWSATLVSGVAGKRIPVSNRAIEHKAGILHEEELQVRESQVVARACYVREKCT